MTVIRCLRWKRTKFKSLLQVRQSRDSWCKKMPLKYRSQQATDHSGISAVPFLLPQKRPTISALSQQVWLLITLDSYGGQLERRKVHSWCAQETETYAGTCSEEHLPSWDVHGREQASDRWQKGRETSCLYPIQNNKACRIKIYVNEILFLSTSCSPSSDFSGAAVNW